MPHPAEINIVDRLQLETQRQFAERTKALLPRKTNQVKVPSYKDYDKSTGSDAKEEVKAFVMPDAFFPEDMQKKKKKPKVTSDAPVGLEEDLVVGEEEEEKKDEEKDELEDPEEEDGEDEFGANDYVNSYGAFEEEGQEPDAFGEDDVVAGKDSRFSSETHVLLEGGFI